MIDIFEFWSVIGWGRLHDGDLPEIKEQDGMNLMEEVLSQ
jgi:hypothetical protein